MFLTTEGKDDGEFEKPGGPVRMPFQLKAGAGGKKYIYIDIGIHKICNGLASEGGQNSRAL